MNNYITINNNNYPIQDEYVLLNTVSEDGNPSRTKCILTNFDEDQAPKEIYYGFSTGGDKKTYKLTLNNETRDIKDVSYALLDPNKIFNTCIAFNE